MYEILGQAVNLTSFDKGVTVAVLSFAGGAAGFMVRRWFKSMDDMDKRDAAHQEEIKRQDAEHKAKVEAAQEKFNAQMLDVYRKNGEHQQQVVSILNSIADLVKNTSGK